jgi:type IV pilus assembly protein PilQ
MKKHKQNKPFRFAIFFTTLLVSILIVWGPPPLLLAANNIEESPAILETSAEEGYLDDVSFQKMQGKERIILTLSKKAAFNVEDHSNHTILMKLDNTFVAKELRRPLGEGLLENVSRVQPDQKLVGEKPWVYLTIELRQRIPYIIKAEKGNIIIDFNTTTLARKIPERLPTNYIDTLKEPKTPKQATINDDIKEPVINQGKEIKKDLEHKIISLDFQDAEIKAVLRLLAELAGISIVSGNDVKGNVTINVQSVPWIQALDTILDINGLAKKRTGNVITVMTFKKMKEDEESRKKGEEERLKADALFKETQQKELSEKGKLRQISIEAKIIEATDAFVRKLGVQWGAGILGTWGKYDIGGLIGTNPSNLTGVTGLPGGIGLTTSNLAVNFPVSIAAPSIGIIMGSAKTVLDAQLAALETSSDGKIISSPKVTTMDNMAATIKQGEQVPYVKIDKDGNRTTEFKDAVLKLEVTPKITPDGKISMQIIAQNDYADWAARDRYLIDVPPINTSQVQSNVTIRNMETLVIGGVLRSTDEKGISGVPWLSKIPVLGWLFKTENITKTKKQLWIFVTPKIIEESTPPENVTQEKS